MRLRIDPLRRLTLQAPLAMALTFGLCTLGALTAQVKAGVPQNGAQPSKQSTSKPGLPLNDPRAFQGYTLVAPLVSTKTYLIDMQGRVVRTWESNYAAGQDAYLLENGHLLRAGRLDSSEQLFAGAGQGGRVQEFTWEGQLVWDFKFHNHKQIAHHDIARLPNGNVLLIVWEIKTPEETIAAGRGRERVGGLWLADSVIEIKPTGMTTGEVVWEWHIWDHLIQDNDSSKANYGEVGAHPELIDVNFDQDLISPLPRVAQSPKQEEQRKNNLNKLKGIGYVGTAAARGNLGLIPDWTHVNSVAYHADLDQVMLSVRAFNEFWIIDHSTTSAEAAGHTGGRSGKGGDLLYRWGNPRAYRAGTAKDQRLFAQHDAHWIPRGRPGEGHVLVFNNGSKRPSGNYSSVDEIVLPVDSQGRYARRPGTAYGPEEPVWSYTAPTKSDFSAWIMSGAQRLPNGNTLICDSMKGTFFEVTPEKDVVWKYTNPDKGGSGVGRIGNPSPIGPPAGGFGTASQSIQILPSFLQDMLKLTAGQKKELIEFQKEISGKLDKVLTDEQKKQLKEPQAFGTGGPGSRPQPGQIMTPTLQARLKLTAGQKKQVAELQKETDRKLDKLLRDEQKSQLKEMRQSFGRGGPPGGMRPAGGFGGGPGGFMGAFFGRSVFRAYRYAPNYPGLVGKDLTPGKTVEELQPKEPKAK